MNILERVAAWARRTPDRLAHLSGAARLTYADLDHHSDTVAGAIHNAIGADRSPVAVVGHKQPEMLLGMLGCLKAGHPYVPVDTSVPAHRLAQIIAAAGARMVLSPGGIAEMLAGEPHPRPEQPRAASDVVYVMFTSGSTGQPKGVVITAANLSSFLDWLLAEHPPAVDEVVLNQAPFSFDLSVMDLYFSLASGGTLVSLSAEHVARPGAMFAVLAQTAISTWVSTPSFAQLCLAEPRFDQAMLPRLRRMLFCGEVLPRAVAEQLLERFPRAQVWNTYGPTEATVATTSVRIDRAALARHGALPVGYAKPDSRVMVAGTDGQPLGEGQRGEIIIAGPNVSPGYLGQPELTRRSFFDLDGARAYRTGDWGHLADGLLFWDGRIDNQVKLHGHRIELGDVEANLRAVADVRDAVVVAIHRDGRVDALAAFVILASGPTEADFAVSQRLRRGLAERLPAYMVPRVVQVVASFPMTANGKVDRRALAGALT